MCFGCSVLLVGCCELVVLFVVLWCAVYSLIIARCALCVVCLWFDVDCGCLLLVCVCHWLLLFLVHR